MARLHPLLQPYRPTPEDPFDAVKAAHLLNRAGFGGTREEIAKTVELGPQAAVKRLLDFADKGAAEQDDPDGPDLSSIEGYPKNFRELQRTMLGKSEQERMEFRQMLQRANRQAVEAIGAWWLFRMTYGPHPLQEKLTLFWHGHFTTSVQDERSAWLIWKQLETLRANAAGNFRTFVQRISRDPAMLDYLNNQQNRKRSPNENYARELMELFTLGIGNYTENDIKEAARAFTGWGHNGDEFTFRRWDHDDDEKLFFGKRGNFDGDDIIDLILNREQCGKYVGTKLFRYFVTEQVDEPVQESLGDVLRNNSYELRPLLETIFTSRIFYSPQVIGCQIKSPVQLVLGTVRALELQMPPTRMLYGTLNQMGQVPHMPPNVKGWPGGRAWINTSTLLARYNAAIWLAGGDVALATGRPGVDRFLQRRGGTNFSPDASGSKEQIVDEWLARLIQRPVAPEKRQVLIDAMGSSTSPESVRKMVQLIVSMPEYQLC